MLKVSEADSRTPINVLIDYMSVTVFAIIWFTLAYKVYIAFVNFPNLLVSGILLFASLIVAFLVTDFATGFAHFSADNFGDEKVPYFGRRWIKPFRDHHVDPSEIVEHNFSQLNGKTAILCMPFIIGPIIFFENPATAGSIFWHGFFLFFTLGALLTNSIHRYAHMKNPPWIIAKMQKYHLILSHQEHTIHHTYPYTTHYCITTGWFNLILNRIPFFTKDREKILTPKQIAQEKLKNLTQNQSKQGL